MNIKQIEEQGRQTAAKNNVGFTSFKSALSELHTNPEVFSIDEWYNIFNDYCFWNGRTRGVFVSVAEFAKEYFIGWNIQEHNTQLKTA